MVCPLCRTRKARRHCPALGHTICAVCCGTKRLTEIACPAGCPYLATAREHPPAVVRRQQERDFALFVPMVQGLTDRQFRLFLLFQTAIAKHTPEGLARLRDEDVAEAAAALAATLETAARGVIYEHPAPSVPAQRLLTGLKAFLDDLRQHGAAVFDGEAAAVLRAIERGARGARQAAEGGDTAYLTMMARLIERTSREGERGAEAAGGASSLIVP